MANASLPQCFDCGQFCHPAAWKLLYSGAIPTPDREIFRCAKCLASLGPFTPQAGIKPEYSCGLVRSAEHG